MTHSTLVSKLNHSHDNAALKVAVSVKSSEAGDWLQIHVLNIEFKLTF